MAAAASNDDGRKKKGRGHRSGTGTLLAGRGDVSAAVPASRQKYPAPSVEGWILMVTGVHEDATDDDVRVLSLGSFVFLFLLTSFVFDLPRTPFDLVPCSHPPLLRQTFF